MVAIRLPPLQRWFHDVSRDIGEQEQQASKHESKEADRLLLLGKPRRQERGQFSNDVPYNVPVQIDTIRRNRYLASVSRA